MSPIEQRILKAVIKMVHGRKWRPKAMYLTHEDYAAFVAARSTWRERNYVDGIEVKVTHGKRQRSRLYADHGYSGVTI